MTHYYFSYQIDLYKLCVRYVAYIYRLTQRNHFYPELGLVKMEHMLTHILQGQDPLLT